jgi:phosphopantetheinyl transferase
VYIYLCDRDQIEKGEDAIRRFSIEYAEDAGMGIPVHTVESALIFRSPAGKPSFLDLTEIHFSISHSGSIWGCAFENTPIGFDLEDMNRIKGKKDQDLKHGSGERWQKIARRFFTSEECEFVRKGGKEAFFRLWVRKEAYVKYKGLKLLQELPLINLVTDGELLTELPDAHVEELNLGQGLIGAYCAAKKKNIRKITDYRNINIEQDA